MFSVDLKGSDLDKLKEEALQNMIDFTKSFDNINEAGMKSESLNSNSIIFISLILTLILTLFVFINIVKLSKKIKNVIKKLENVEKIKYTKKEEQNLYVDIEDKFKSNEKEENLYDDIEETLKVNEKEETLYENIEDKMKDYFF